MDVEAGLAGEGGGGGVDSVYVMPDGCGPHATIGGEDPREEEAVACGGSNADPAACLADFFSGFVNI